MSKYIATRAQRGANALVTEAEIMLNKALAEKGGDTPVLEVTSGDYFQLVARQESTVSLSPTTGVSGCWFEMEIVE